MAAARDAGKPYVDFGGLLFCTQEGCGGEIEVSAEDSEGAYTRNAIEGPDEGLVPPFPATCGKCYEEVTVVQSTFESVYV